MYAQYPPPPPNYVMLAPQPYYPPPYTYRRSRCSLGSFCRCLCCIFCYLIMLFALSLLLMYMLFKPKMPEYMLEDFVVKKCNIEPNLNADVELQLTIRAENPNARVSLLYGSDSWVSVSFSDTEICNGKLPEFRQGYHNMTMVQINLSGNTTLEPKVAESFKESQKNGNIQLMAKVKAPISVIFEEMKLRMFIIYVNIQMTVNSLSPDKKPDILSANYQFFINHLI